jgi:hypothetical protein
MLAHCIDPAPADAAALPFFADRQHDPCVEALVGAFAAWFEFPEEFEASSS